MQRDAVAPSTPEGMLARVVNGRILCRWSGFCFAPRTMQNRTSLLLAIVCGLAFTGCSKKETPVQTALGELRRLDSEIHPALQYAEYSNRLAEAQRRIAVALQKSKDAGANARIEKAMNIYVEAQQAWHREKDTVPAAPAEVVACWEGARRATDGALEFTSADPAKRTKIWQQELAVVEAAARAEQDAKEQAEQAERARQVAEAETRARRWAAEQRRAVEEAERERTRRFAPDGTVYSLTRISFTTGDSVESIAPGTELNVISRSERGTLRVKRGSLETEVAASAVTNDRDLAASLRPVPVKQPVSAVGGRSASITRVRAVPRQ